MAFEKRKRIAAGRDRQKILLLVLILLVTGVVLYRQAGGRGSPEKGADNAQALSNKISNSADPVLMIDKLKETPQETDQEKRNLFAFYEPPPPPPARAAVAEQESEEPEIVCGDGICMAGETYENCSSDCQPPPPPEIALKYIGYLSQSGGAVVFLTDGKDVYMGRENDIIANKYRVLKITDENVELGYLNLNQSRTIPFAGNKGS